ncbi:glutamyl-tRNA reductase [Cesiribacter sp. SM1]|uniref:glutamyl-tRNA reductase n=1 Tax=Cesiribacter sp. SM1 TaxID=2861196 RepID=UPI001CD36AE0|nr:glutamyl-tRNA reductase [Cesiribacter sp. SM1]
MQLQLRYISISHQNASIAIRQLFHLSDAEQLDFFRAVQLSFQDIRSLMVVCTCNRMEVYFESQDTCSSSMLSFLLSRKGLTERADELSSYFFQSENTISTAYHLLKVTNGLDSRISGDAQIIQQVKSAFMQAVQLNMQGKLLERSIQAAFRLHKKISNQTAFRSGTVSFAYLSLKNIQAVFGKEALRQKRLLIAGAGEIAEEVAKYSGRFAFKEVVIANRTEARAAELAKKYNLQTTAWELLESHRLENFDAIISCVSNRSHLIKSGYFQGLGKKVVLIDLAMPANLQKPAAPLAEVQLFDLDTLAEVKDTNEENRLLARTEAEKLLLEEVDLFTEWVNNIPVHQALRQFRSGMEDEIRGFLLHKYKTDLPEHLIAEISTSLARKISRKPAKALSAQVHNGQVRDYLKVFSELF